MNFFFLKFMTLPERVESVIFFYVCTRLPKRLVNCDIIYNTTQACCLVFMTDATQAHLA